MTHSAGVGRRQLCQDPSARVGQSLLPQTNLSSKVICCRPCSLAKEVTVGSQLPKEIRLLCLQFIVPSKGPTAWPYTPIGLTDPYCVAQTFYTHQIEGTGRDSSAGEDTG